MPSSCQVCQAIGECRTTWQCSNAPVKKLTEEESKSAEITRMKEQLARTERERDQAIAVGGIRVIERGHIVSCTNHIHNKDVVENINELYMHLTHLAGKVEG